MRELKLTLETVTPLFLGGADPRGAPELRPPAFRGAMRYWLRAALGGVIGDQDLDPLKRAESEVFGSTEGTGAVGVRVLPANLKHTPPDALLRVRGIAPKQKFHLVLYSRSASLAAWYSAVGALLLAVAFGGLGRRSRRGMGTVRITHSDSERAGLDDALDVTLKAMPASLTDWSVYLDNAVRQSHYAVRTLCADLGIKTVEIDDREHRFPVLSQNLTRLLYAKLFDTPDLAIKEFSEARKRDGLLANLLGGISPRRNASPLWMRTLPALDPSSKEKFAISVLLFESTFPQQIPSDYPRVKQFLGKLAQPDTWGQVEVH